MSKKAWSVYRSGARKSTSKPKSKGRKNKTAKKNRGGGGRKTFGTVGWKGFIAAIASLSLLRIAINRLSGGRMPGEYVDSLSMVGAGIVGKATGIGTAHLLTPGIVLGSSKVVEDIVTPGGLWTLPQLGGGNGGYDL